MREHSFSLVFCNFLNISFSSNTSQREEYEGSLFCRQLDEFCAHMIECSDLLKQETVYNKVETMYARHKLDIVICRIVERVRVLCQ